MIFQTKSPMTPFMFSELKKIFNQLLRLVFRKDAIDQVGKILKKITNKKKILRRRLGRCWLYHKISFRAKLKYHRRKNELLKVNIKR